MRWALFGCLQWEHNVGAVGFSLKCVLRLSRLVLDIRLFGRAIIPPVCYIRVSLFLFFCLQLLQRFPARINRLVVFHRYCRITPGRYPPARFGTQGLHWKRNQYLLKNQRGQVNRIVGIAEIRSTSSSGSALRAGTRDFSWRTIRNSPATGHMTGARHREHCALTTQS